MKFGHDMILPIKYTVDWKLTSQKKQTQINKYNISENINRVDHDYKVGDKVMFTQHTAHKYETPYTGPSAITRCWTNVMFSLKFGATEIGYNIRCIIPYKYDTKVKDFSSKNMSDNVNT